MGRGRWGTVRGRLVAAMVLVALAPLVGVSAYAFSSQRDTLRDDALAHLESVASLQESRIAAFVTNELALVSLVTSRTQLRVSVADVILSGDTAEQERAAGILRDARGGTPGILAISVADPQGRVVVSTEPERVGSSEADAALLTRGTSAASFGPVRARESVLQATVAAPMALPDGSTAVALVDVSLAPLVGLVVDYTGLGRTGETVVARREPDGSALFIAPLRFDRDAALERRVQPEGEDTAVLQALAGEETLLTDSHDYRGRAVLAATRMVPTTEWGVVVKIDRSEAFAPVERLRNLLLGAIAAAALATAGLAWFLGRSLTRPLRKLRETAEAVRGGDLERRAEVRGRDEVAGVAAAFNDMTQRLLEINRTLEERVQQRTAELTESEGRFRGAFDGAPVGMAITSLDGRYLEVNRTLCELFGRTEAEMLGLRWGDVTHPDDRALSRKFLDDVLATGATYTIEKRYLKPDGSLVWVLLSVSVLRDRQGAPVRFLAHVQDITGRKEAEQALARSNEALEQFAYVASHDLQEPLRVVTGFVQLVERRYADDLPDGAQELLSYIRDGVGRMKQLLDDLFELARVQRAPLRRTSVALDEVVSEVLGDLGAALDEAGASVAVGALPVVQADAGLVSRVLSNLLGNAVKFRSPERRPAVRISARRLDGGWRLDVADNGIGIQMGDRGRVFGMFERLHGREEYAGTGVGLAIVRAAITRLGGAVGVEETPGGGSTFWFTLADGGGVGAVAPGDHVDAPSNLT